MKILHISKYYYPYIGGVENTCKYLVDSFSKKNDVAVVCFNEGKEDICDEINGVKIYEKSTGEAGFRVLSKITFASRESFLRPHLCSASPWKLLGGNKLFDKQA